MNIYHSLNDLTLQNSCIAIGVFDGVHRGHQAVLQAAARAAESLGPAFSAVVLTFDRHPAELLAPQRAPLAVASLDQRLEWMDDLGVLSAVVVIPFSLSFANMSPRAFVESVLVSKLGAREVLVGADFRFGKDRKGSVMDLEAAGETHGFDVKIVHPITTEGERISSTRIRDLIMAGQVEQASSLLGRDFTLRGTVVVGKQLGRTLGFPTANLALEEPRQALPSFGVYAGRLRVKREAQWYPAAISVGTNPTTDGDSVVVKVEAFVLGGFDADLYEKTVDVAFVSHIRGQETFRSLDDLTRQMHADVAAISKVLG